MLKILLNKIIVKSLAKSAKFLHQNCQVYDTKVFRHPSKIPHFRPPISENLNMGHRNLRTKNIMSRKIRTFAPRRFII